MIKRIFKLKSADKIAASYNSYAEFAHHASDREKVVVIEDAIKKANELQKQAASSTKVPV